MFALSSSHRRRRRQPAKAHNIIFYFEEREEIYRYYMSNEIIVDHRSTGTYQWRFSEPCDILLLLDEGAPPTIHYQVKGFSFYLCKETIPHFSNRFNVYTTNTKNEAYGASAPNRLLGARSDNFWSMLNAIANLKSERIDDNCLAMLS